MPKDIKKNKKRQKKKQEITTPSILKEIYSSRLYFSIIIVVFLAIMALYVRMIPAFKHGIELHANDPWIMYWVTDYLVKHGITSWFSLTQANPDTHIFWYPWGRDFVHSEYPLTMFITALFYPIGKAIGLTVKEWSAVIPPIFGSLIVITAYLLAREMGGEIPGLFAAFFTAFMPGVYDRTLVGFIEKEAIAMPFLLLGLYFLARTLRSGKILYPVLTGILIGLIAWTWGGYQAVYAILGLTFALFPIVKGISTDDLRKFGVITGIIILLSMLSPTVGPKETLIGAGTIILGGYILLVYASLLDRYSDKISIVDKIGVKRFYTISLIVAVIIGILLIVSGALDISARALYFFGKHSTDPLIASVSEHQAPSINYLFSRTGLPILLSIIYVIWGIFRVRKDPRHIVMLVPAIIMLYVGFRSSYLLQTVSTVLSVTGALALAPVSYYFVKSLGLSETTKKSHIDTLGSSLWALTIVVIVILGSMHAMSTLTEANTIVPSIKAGGLGLPVENDAWYKALDILANTTDENSVVIAWWDYGYWISVGSGRATVADGATLNSTQIRLLAKALTAQNETEALNILYNDFHAPPNDTYIVIYDVFRSLQSGIPGVWLTGPYVSVGSGTVGLADIPKSIWMLRIGERMGLNEISPYFTPVKIQVDPSRYAYVITPVWNSTLVKNTLIYRMFIDGVYNLPLTMTPGCINMTGTHLFVDWTSYAQGQLTSIADSPMEHIKPYKTAVSCIFDGENEKLYVAVFIFKVS